ncbi:MAG TPA: sulfotransferase [Candidatus Binatia bacterium]|nr:sulfotransferase [Candidatus Binatia bacterium]
MNQFSTSKPWIAVPILGVGRSGTSAITRALQCFGVDLGNNLRPGSGKNPTGFYEDLDFLKISKRLKRALGVRSESVRLIDDAEYDLPAVKEVEDATVEMIHRRFGASPVWGYKYARTSRFMPFFERVFDRCGLEVRYVFAMRNPLSVARSRARLEPQRGTQHKSDLEWLTNVVPHFERARGARCVFVDYDNVVAGPAAEIERMATRLGFPVDDRVRREIEIYRSEYLKPGIRHSRFSIEQLDEETDLNVLVRDAFRWLWKLSTDQISFDDEQLWTDWRRIASRVQDLKPVLAHVDRIEAELRAAQRSWLGPLQGVPSRWYKWRAR